jgi:hypothetical protein
MATRRGKGAVLFTGRLSQDGGQRRLTGPAAGAAHPVAGALGVDLHAGSGIDPVIVLVSHISY